MTDDEYYLYEEIAHRVQVMLLNGADRYLEDAHIQLRIPRKQGVIVSPYKMSKPYHPGPFDMPLPEVVDPEALDYPDVANGEDYYCVKDAVGDVRHHVPTPAFQVPLRLVLSKSQVGQEIDVEWTISAKNLPQPIQGHLTIRVTDASS